jgi:glycosyltransferase involved in cell wall biosynthesis
MEEFASGGLLRWTNRAFTRRLTKRAVDADAVIATDENMVDSVIANIGVARERVCVVPNAVDSERLISLANQHPLKTHSGVLIVSVGRMVYNKGYDVLASALYELAISGRLPAGTVWRHFGSGPMARDIMEAVRKSGAFEYEQVPGAPDAEVQGYLSVADVFVQPSRYEGSSLTTLEAMCHGTVVVGTRTGGIPDKVVDGCTGFLAQPGDSDSLASAIGRALASDRQIVGRSAQERVTEMFDAKVAAKQLSIVLANSHA